MWEKKPGLPPFPETQLYSEHPIKVYLVQDLSRFAPRSLIIGIRQTVDFVWKDEKQVRFSQVLDGTVIVQIEDRRYKILVESMIEAALEADERYTALAAPIPVKNKLSQEALITRGISMETALSNKSEKP